MYQVDTASLGENCVCREVGVQGVCVCVCVCTCGEPYVYVVSINELGGYVSLADLGTSWALLLGHMGGLESPSGALWRAWVDLVGP